MEKLRRILTKEYGLDVQEVRRMSAGVGGETYGVQTPQGKFVYKIADLEKLTYSNSHGDYTVNQIICGKEKINAVIDWTSACVHPVIWEITRSFFLAEHSCAEGEINEAQFRDYVEGYCSEAMLTKYDKDNLLRLYCYQIGVCDYYAQYLSADEDKKDEYLSQAKFATKVMRNQLMV